MAKAKLSASLSTDRNLTSTRRTAYDSVELGVIPLVYGDMSSVDVTVWADGKVYLTVRDHTGAVVHTHTYERASLAPERSPS